jgi:hypothetical protein
VLLHLGAERMPPNKSPQPTATSRCVERPEMFIDHSLSLESTVVGLWLSFGR